MAPGLYICILMSVVGPGTGWLHGVDCGNPTKSFTYRNSFDSTLKDDMIGNEMKNFLAPAKIKRIVMTRAGADPLKINGI